MLTAARRSGLGFHRQRVRLRSPVQDGQASGVSPVHQNPEPQAPRTGKSASSLSVGPGKAAVRYSYILYSNQPPTVFACTRPEKNLRTLTGALRPPRAAPPLALARPRCPRPHSPLARSPLLAVDSLVPALQRESRMHDQNLASPAREWDVDASGMESNPALTSHQIGGAPHARAIPLSPPLRSTTTPRSCPSQVRSALRRGLRGMALGAWDQVPLRTAAF